MAVTYGGRACVDPIPHKETCDRLGLNTDKWFGRVNSFKLTSDKTPGSGCILLRKADLDALDLIQYQTLTFIGDTTGPLSLTNITILSYECTCPGSADDPDAVYYCDVVDQRHFFAKNTFTSGYRAYNVTVPDGGSFQTDTLNSGSPWTWDGVFQDLITKSGVGALGVFTLPFTPHLQPENLIYLGTPWEALNDLMDRLALAWAFGFAASFGIVRVGVDQDASLVTLEASSSYLGRTYDGYGIDPDAAWYPEKVKVIFRRYPKPDVTSGETPFYAVDITLPANAAIKTGTYVELYDDLSALGATGTPSNSSTLSTRATERASDWLRKRRYYDRPLTRAWADIQPNAVLTVGRSANYVVWDDRGGVMQTWARSEPTKTLENWRPLADYPPWWPFTTGGTATVSAWKEPVRAATTTTLPSNTYSNGTSGVGATLTGNSNGALAAQDGVTLVAGDALLVKNQASQFQNGIYTVTQVGSVSTPYILTRRADADSATDLLGATVTVMEGTSNGTSIWKDTAVAPITVGTTNLVWAKVYPPQLTGDVITSVSVLTLAADDTWYQFPTSFTLPSAGTYLFTGVCGVTARLGGGAPGLIKVHLFNLTTSAQVGGDYPASVEVSAFNYTYQVVTISLKLTVTGSTSFCYRGLRYVSTSGSTWANAALGGGFTPVTYTWLKLTD